MADSPTNQGSFNQAGFQQQRIDELFTTIDRISNMLFQRNVDLNEWNYNLVFINLNSLVGTISPKCTPTEVEELEKKRILVRHILRTRKPFESITRPYLSGHKTEPCNNYTNQDLISDCLFDYRKNIESVMDKHGLANPSKFNPTTAVVN